MQAAGGTPKQQSDLEVLNYRQLQRDLLSQSSFDKSADLPTQCTSAIQSRISGSHFWAGFFARAGQSFDAARVQDRRAVLEHAVKSTNIVNASSTWRILFEIIQTS